MHSSILKCLYLVKTNFLSPQSAELDLDSQTRQLEHLNTKGKQLVQESRNLPHFESSVISDDMDKLNKTWKNSAKVRYS